MEDLILHSDRTRKSREKLQWQMEYREEVSMDNNALYEELVNEKEAEEEVRKD